MKRREFYGRAGARAVRTFLSVYILGPIVVLGYLVSWAAFRNPKEVLPELWED